ncbi:MAG: hypothetical protein JNL10_15385 [Verrucomicrobiales bacterium]|nr:hypothetical protein [Verrucomicrobiales bacterium]
MSTKTLSILLAVVVLNLGIGWFVTARRSIDREAEAAARIARMSNDLVETTSRLTQEQKEAMLLRTNLAQRTDELGTVSHRLTEMSEALLKTENSAKAAAATAAAEIEKRDHQITELEGERDGLTKQMDGLNQEIGSLNGRIQDTERKLAASEGDRAQLQKELKRLLAEKAELERKFNDLAALRDQVRKLKEELSIARRIDLIRRGLYGSDKKGAQILNEGIRNTAAVTPGTNAPVKAELGTDGSIRVDGATPPPPR